MAIKRTARAEDTEEQMTHAPRITVIIPTRERCDVLESALRTVTSQDYDNLQIIVSDNFSSDATAEVVARANNKRITYLNTGRRLSMSANWEFALSHVDGGWVSFMGDDDGLLPGSLATVANIIRTHPTKAIRSAYCVYAWPGMAEISLEQLVVPFGSGQEIRQSSHWLSRVMRGRATYTQLPSLYNGGFVHMSVMNEIRQKTGSYFLSVSPDIYSAVAIASVIDTYIYSHEPLAISGTSKHSTGHSFFSPGKQGNPSPRAEFSKEGNLPFHDEMPLCVDGSYPLSLHANTYEAYLQSRRLRSGNVMNPAEQLAITMATAGRHRKSIEQWGRQFAELHQINYYAAKRSASRLRLLLQPYAMAQKIFAATNCAITENLPIKNVYDAALAAAAIKASARRSGALRFFVKRLMRVGR